MINNLKIVLADLSHNLIRINNVEFATHFTFNNNTVIDDKVEFM